MAQIGKTSTKGTDRSDRVKHVSNLLRKQPWFASTMVDLEDQASQTAVRGDKLQWVRNAIDAGVDPKDLEKFISSKIKGALLWKYLHFYGAPDYAKDDETLKTYDIQVLDQLIKLLQLFPNKEEFVNFLKHELPRTSSREENATIGKERKMTKKTATVDSNQNSLDFLRKADSLREKITGLKSAIENEQNPYVKEVLTNQLNQLMEEAKQYKLSDMGQVKNLIRTAGKERTAEGERAKDFLAHYDEKLADLKKKQEEELKRLEEAKKRAEENVATLDSDLEELRKRFTAVVEGMKKDYLNRQQKNEAIQQKSQKLNEAEKTAVEKAVEKAVEQKQSK